MMLKQKPNETEVKQPYSYDYLNVHIINTETEVAKEDLTNLAHGSTQLYTHKNKHKNSTPAE